MKLTSYLLMILLMSMFRPIQAETTLIKTAPKQGKHYVSGMVSATVKIDEHGKPQPPQWQKANPQLMKMAQKYRFPQSYQPKQQCNPQNECVPIAYTEQYRWIFIAPKTDNAIRIVHAAKPNYPMIALDNQEEGKVKVGIIVAPDGSVAYVSVRQSSGSRILDRAAVRAAYQYQFSPITYAGNPVYYAWVIQPIDFELQ